MKHCLKTKQIYTPIGDMLAVADEEYLYMLDFLQDTTIKPKLALLQKQAEATIESGSLPLLEQVEREVAAYFKGELKEFTLPLYSFGTPFQQRVWQQLKTIPFGSTISYREVASAMGEDLAIRAAASANGKNKLAIVIPCHRVIQADGKIGGYNGGVERKRKLLLHEGVFI